MHLNTILDSLKNIECNHGDKTLEPLMTYLQRLDSFKLTIVEILKKRCDILSNELRLPTNLANDTQNPSLTWFYNSQNEENKHKNDDILKGINFRRLINILSIDNFASFHVRKNNSSNVYTSLDGPNVNIPC